MKAQEFPYQYNLTVTFQDMDAMRHVNNVTYIAYLETARVRYLFDLLQFTDFETFPIILGDVYCRYLAPAYFNDVLTVGLGVNRFGRKSFDFIYQIDNQDGLPIIQAKTSMITFDYQQQKTILIPDYIRASITKFQQGWHHDFVV
ncbi:MAG TPA: acyl-CoA thioesterase [Anaerolineae bacterium]|nr:acyl-CoA thioesterase [Anaerolineae bacterium]